MEIDILPLEGKEKVPTSLLVKLVTVLAKRDIKTRVLTAKKVPKTAWSKNREQYDAHKIIAQLGKRGVLAITSVDVFEGGLNFVYGLAYAEGSAIVSAYRLRPEFYGEKKDESVLLQRLAKECMHEIGHTLGMKHCARTIGKKQCAMTFSMNIHEVDAKASRFCKEHAKLLE